MSLRRAAAAAGLLAMLTLLAAAVPPPGVRGPLVAARAQQSCGFLGIATCPTPTPAPATPTPPQFVIPPVSGAPLPSATAPATTPAPTAAGPTPTSTPLPVVAVPVPPSATPTPVTVGGDRNVTIQAVEPSSTGSAVDGGTILLRLFFLLALLAVGSVVAVLALR